MVDTNFLTLSQGKRGISQCFRLERSAKTLAGEGSRAKGAYPKFSTGGHDVR